MRVCCIALMQKLGAILIAKRGCRPALEKRLNRLVAVKECYARVWGAPSWATWKTLPLVERADSEIRTYVSCV